MSPDLPKERLVEQRDIGQVRRCFIPMTAEASVNSVTVNRVYDGHLMQMIGLACWNTADARPVVRAAAQHEPLSAW